MRLKKRRMKKIKLRTLLLAVYSIITLGAPEAEYVLHPEAANVRS
jgi:hypothetical protein